MKLKITKYLRRAEEIFNCHLQRTLGSGASPGTVRRCSPPVGQRVQGWAGRAVCQGCPSSSLPLASSLSHTLCCSFIFQHVVNHLNPVFHPSREHTHLPTLAHGSYTCSHVHTLQGPQACLCWNGPQYLGQTQIPLCVHTHTCTYRCSPPMAFPNPVHTQGGLRRHTHLSCPQVCTDIHTHCWAHFSPSQAPGPRVLVFTACSLGSTCSQVIPSPREHLPPGDAFWGGF